MRGLLINPDRSTDVRDFPDLASLQAAVGGYIEAIYLPDRSVCFVNEEGLLENLPPNVLASNVAQTPYVIVGPAVFVGPVDDDSECTDIGQAWIDRAAVYKAGASVSPRTN